MAKGGRGLASATSPWPPEVRDQVEERRQRVQSGRVRRLETETQPVPNTSGTLGYVLASWHVDFRERAHLVRRNGRTARWSPGHGAVVTAVPVQHIAQMRIGEALFLGELASLDDASFAEPSALPGWDRAHVLGHMARNADALRNLLMWAATGVETPMYPSARDRTEGIEQSAAQTPATLRADVRDASARLVDTVDQLDPLAWSAPVRTARGRPIEAAEVPWMRVRESFVHSVDLRTGVTFDSAPDAVVDQLLEEVAAGLLARGDCPPVLLVPAGTGAGGSRQYRLGDPSAEPVRVHGTVRAALAWLTGRSTGRGLVAGTPNGTLPHLPPWL